MTTLRRFFVAFGGVLALLALQPAWSIGLLPAYDAALVNDPTYRAALHENEAGQQARVLGRAGLLPVVSASYGRSRNFSDITTSTPGLPERSDERHYNSLSSALQLRQPLIHPEGRARYRQGIAQTQASDAQFRSRSQEVIVRLVGLYAPAQYAEDQLALATAQRDAYAEQGKSNERLFQRGEGTRTDVLETQAKLDLSEAQLLEARDNLQNARDALSAMLGQRVTALDPLSDAFRVMPTQPASIETWQDLALNNNPEIVAQRYAVEIAREEINKNQAGHSPRLDLVASLAKNSSDTINTLNQSANTRSIGIQLSIPLYAGGSVTAATTQAVANFEKARANLDGQTSQVLVELRKQFNLTFSSAARIDAARKALESALVLVAATQKSVQGGQRTNVDVLNARQQVFEARRELALQRYNHLLGYLKLRYAAGVLSVSDLRDVAGYFVAGK
ncbi:MAG: TolC family outer membrane protein [Polaromonas sp.]|nr:TolC family outer membrane protein [Polaromonas sp.]